MTYARFDHQTITDLIPQGSTVLDLGCGDGDLLSLLIREKNAHAVGIDNNPFFVATGVIRNKTILQGDVETCLAAYKDKGYDYVVLNKSLTEVVDIDLVLHEALRIGKKVIVGFENLAHYKSRLELFFLGKTPTAITATANRHYFSIHDFKNYCQRQSIEIFKAVYLTENTQTPFFFANLFAVQAIYVISKDHPSVLEKLISAKYRYADGGGI